VRGGGVSQGQGTSVGLGNLTAQGEADSRKLTGLVVKKGTNRFVVLERPGPSSST